MSRIPLADLEQQSESIRHWAAHRGNLNVFRLLANAPNVFGGWTTMVDELFDSNTFSARMREVIILGVANLQASSYELSQHVPLARASGLTEQQIEAIRGTGDLDAAGFSPTERAALDVVTELCTTRQLRDDSFTKAQAIFGDEVFTELLMIISCYYGLALVLNAAELDIDTTARFQP
jgi:4-carboxymuconolactone decarboxylase